MIDLTVVPSALLVPVLEGNLRRLEKRHKVYDHVLEAVRRDLGADATWLDRGLAGGGERLVSGDERLCAFDLSQRMIDEAAAEDSAAVHSRSDGGDGAARTTPLVAGASPSQAIHAAPSLGSASRRRSGGATRSAEKAMSSNAQ